MILIIDGNNLAHIARHAFNLSVGGEDISVVYGFLRLLLKYIEKFKAKSVIVCWDKGVSDYRRSIISEYKANRTRKYDDPMEYEIFLGQMEELNEILPKMGIISVKWRGVEADDLMYHASRIVKGNSVIVTTDKDLLQAIDDHVGVYNPVKSIIYTREDVEEMTGVPFGNFVEWKALQGDSGDNIPGVPGIGAKTSTKLLKQYGSVSGVVNAALGINPKGEISGAMGKNIVKFGMSRIINNIRAIVLFRDMAGARLIVYEAIQNYSKPNKKFIKSYLFYRQFISLLDASFVGIVAHLTKPNIVDNIRIPIVCNKRYPL